MKFKKLEIAGFKSFADKLEVKFGAGITGIVGPNGCGKSNVADSIRWVLGEQSAKLLRGSSMQDVIFNGTDNRKSLSFCEVSLHFDNKEKLFPSIAFDEVVVTRKLYRSGESEYLLNKENVRLKDITDLLRDSGMGREGYSIIGQGRIDELLSAKPEDRRAIFEEAAGISKFKARKNDAERKLGRTRENLLRVNDIMEEKSKILEPLTRQSENARKYLDLRDKLKQLEINTYIHQYNSASEAKECINNRLNGVLEEIDLRQNEYDNCTIEYNEATKNLNDTDKSIDALRERLLELTVGMEKQAGEVKLFNERLSYFNLQTDRLNQENKKLNEDYEQSLQFIEAGSASRELKSGELKVQQTAYEKYSNDYIALAETLTVGLGEVDSRQQQVLDAMSKLADLRSNMSRLIAERSALDTSIADLTKRISFINEKINDDTLLSEEIKVELNKFVLVKNDLSREVDRLYAVNNECLAVINKCATEIDEVNAEFYAAKTRLKMLTEMQRAYEGFAYSVKNILNDAINNKELSSRIQGVVAQIISVKDGFEVAIEMALGSAVQNIVTANEEDAKFLIEYLKKMRYGRITFLPITSIKPRMLDREYNELMKIGGCFGVASQLVTFDSKFAGIMNGLLGNTVIVDNMDTAILLARKSRYGFKIVTLEGDILNSFGSITGGSKKSELTNIFAYDKEIASLAPKLEGMQRKLLELTTLRSDKAKLQEYTAEQIKLLRDNIHSGEIEIAGKNQAYNKLCVNIVDLGEEIELLNIEKQRALDRITEIDTDINSVGELEQIEMGAKLNASESGAEQRLHFETMRKERDCVHEFMAKSRIAATTLETEINSIDNEIKRLQANVISVSLKIEKNNIEIAEYNKTIAKIQLDMRENTLGKQENDTDTVREIRSKLGNLDEFKQQKQDVMANLDKSKSELMTSLQQLHDKKSKEEMQLLKVDSDIETMETRVREEYSMEYADCLPFKDEQYDITKGVAESGKIKRQMTNLGNVNIGAIEQCQEVFESYHNMEEQRDDLVKAENDLMKIIKDLSAEMLGRFTTQFAQIRINFVKIFKELFDGGTADLLLLENENLLEAGIEIVAQPPQKKLQSISLLSGGERALTAIAILFAILRLKPMPFCVLDEIEAALDDANAGRFAKYLRRFSEETQFIVITHRKPTMELADSLYGVTMEEKGVSKIVSVKLSEAVNYEAGAV